MFTLPADDILQSQVRFPERTLGHPIAATLLLLGAGGLATILTASVNLRLGIPGHNIILTTLPTAAGLALAPRRGGGTLIGLGALGTLGLYSLMGTRVAGPGALTSLLLLGPLLDVALHWQRRGVSVVVAFLAAGFLSNAVGFSVRAAAKLFLPGWGGGGGAGRALQTWFPLAVLTYTGAGLIAGGISAAIWFRMRRRSNPDA